jgi:hypothetical protein
MADVTYARANRSFGAIRQGEIVEIGPDDARGQVLLSSGYLTVVEDGKGAKKVKLGDLETERQWDKTVWDGGVTRGAGFDAESINAKSGQPVTGDAKPTEGLKSTPVPFTSEHDAEGKPTKITITKTKTPEDK